MYLVKTWDFSNNCYAFDHYNAKAKMLLLLSHWNWQGMCVERSRVPTLQICKRMWPQEKSHHQMGLLRFSYTYVLNRSSFVEKLINWVRFLSNAIIIQDSGGFKDSDLEFLNLKSKLIIKGVLRTVRVSASPMVMVKCSKVWKIFNSGRIKFNF